MKPNKVFLIIASVFLTFGIILGGIYVYVSKTLTPENVRVLITKSLQETFPKAKISVVDVDFKFGTSIEFVINEINIQTDRPLASVSDAKLKIPVWSILKGGGVVELEVNAPQFLWLKKPNQDSNWASAMKGQNKVSSENSKAMALPAFLITSRLNIKMKNSKIKYELGPNEKGEFLVTKFLIKELGLDSPAAFEVDTSFVFQQDSLGELSANVLLIGEADLHRYLSDGQLSVISVITASKISSPALPLVNIPDIRIDLKADINKTGTVKSDLKANFYESQASVSIDVNDQYTNIKNIKADFLLDDLMKVWGNSLSNLSVGKSSLGLTGNLSIKEKGIEPDLKLNITKGLTYNYRGILLQPIVSGELNKKLLNFKLETSLLQGSLSSDISTILPNEFSYDLKNLPLLKIKSLATGLNIKTSDLERMNEAVEKTDVSVKSSDTSKEISEDKSSKNNTTTSNSPQIFVLPMLWDLSVIESKYEAMELVVDSSLSISKKGEVNHQFSLMLDDGKITNNLNANLSEVLKGKSKTSFKDFPGSFVNPFIPQKQMSISGVLSGSVNTNFKKDLKSLTYASTFNLNAKKGRVSKIDISSWLLSIASDIEEYLPKAKEQIQKLKLEPDFSSLEAVGSLDQSSINFKKIYFRGIEDKFEIDAKGYVSFEKEGESELFASYRDYDGNLSSFLNKEVGTEVLPLRLIGSSFDIKPDVAFTTKKLTKTFLQKKGASKVKDIAKKLLKDTDKKKLDKLLKGILK